MSRNASLALGLTLLPGIGWAQEALPTLPEVMAQVQDTEVHLQGFIGRGPEGMVRFVLPGAEDTGFPVIFEADDAMNTMIEGCGFDGTGALPCRMAGYGYLHWEVPRLKVVLTSIESIAAPAVME